MNLEENKALVRRWFDEFVNQGELSVADEMLSPDYFYHNPLPGEGPGVEGAKWRMQRLLEAFPDLHETIDDILAEEDRVMTRRLIRGTHRGTFRGIPPTGKAVAIAAMTIHRIAGGKFVER